VTVAGTEVGHGLLISTIPLKLEVDGVGSTLQLASTPPDRLPQHCVVGVAVPLTVDMPVAVLVALGCMAVEETIEVGVRVDVAAPDVEVETAVLVRVAVAKGVFVRVAEGGTVVLLGVGLPPPPLVTVSHAAEIGPQLW